MVAGTARGIGRAIARALAREGARQAFLDVDPAGEAAARELDATFVQANLADEAARERAFEAARRALGRVDVLVNNAAVSAPGSALTVRLDGWRRVLEVNLTAPMHLSTLFARALPQERGGATVQVASVQGLFAEEENVAYNASKGASST